MRFLAELLLDGAAGIVRSSKWPLWMRIVLAVPLLALFLTVAVLCGWGAAQTDGPVSVRLLLGGTAVLTAGYALWLAGSFLRGR